MKPTYEQLEAQLLELSVKLANVESKCAELAAENGELKPGAGFFAYSEETGFETHKTKAEAIASADDMIGVCREEACSDGWPEDADSICWGIILQKAVEGQFEKPAEENGWIGWSEYSLSPSTETPATDAYLAEVRAQARNEGVNYAASRLAAAYNHGFVDKPLAEVYDVVRMILTTKEDLANEQTPAADGLSGEYAEKSLVEFAAQLRQGAAQ